LGDSLNGRKVVVGFSTAMIFQAIDTLYAALIDPARRERTAIGTFVVYLLLWTLYAVIAKGSQDIHVDMAELIVWSRDLAFGFGKHPPLAAIIVSLWFNVFPIADWSYYLLSVLVATLALWIAWLLFKDYLDPKKRVIGLALLTLIPFFNFLALTFNVNTILMPLWAATTLWFLRSYETKDTIYAALAGVGAAACLYAKYWSIFLLFGLGVAALLHIGRGPYFRSRAPWITSVVCILLLIPHIGWLIEHHFAPFAYVIAVHGEKSFAAASLGALKYLLDCQLYVTLPVVLVLVAAWPSLPTLIDLVWPAENDRRLVALSFWGPLLSSVAAALVAGFRPVGLWSMSMWTLLPVMLLSSPVITIARRDARGILALAVAVPVVSLIASPAIAIAIHKVQSVKPHALHGRMLAMRVDKAWAAATSQPLRFVDGIADLAFEVAAYSRYKPRALVEMPPIKQAKIAQSGKVYVCNVDTDCARNVLATASHEPTTQSMSFYIARDHFIWSGASQGYQIVVFPPKP
jgi:4-amino-4-deoxy-L-arabinose transferase-like glycosyltransferase